MNKAVLGFLSLITVGCAASPAPPPADPTAGVAHMCSGIPDDVRVQNALYQPGAIAAVKPLHREVTQVKTRFRRPDGATVYVRATPGTTRAWLERELQCHAARQMQAGDAATHDPLAPSNGRATVRVAEVEAGYAVQIRGSDTRTALEILKRARALASPGGG